MLLSPMQTLRHVRWLVRLVLAGFVMSIGVAVASPMLHPQALELICSGAGVIELRSHTDGGAVPQSGHQPDCPLCVQVGAPAPGRLADQPRPHPSAHGLRPPPAPPLAPRPPAPLPPRPGARAAGRPAPAPPLGTGPARPRCHAYRCAHCRAPAAARAPGRPLISCILIAAGASDSSASILSGRHVHGPVGIPPNRER